MTGEHLLQLLGAFVVGILGTGIAAWLTLARKLMSRADIEKALEAVEADALTAMEKRMNERYITFLSGPMQHVTERLGELRTSMHDVRDRVSRIEKKIDKMNGGT